MSLFVRQKLQDGQTNLNQTFSGDAHYPRRKFRSKRFRLQPKRSENSPFPVRFEIRSPPLCVTEACSAGGKTNTGLISSKSSVVTFTIPGANTRPEYCILVLVLNLHLIKTKLSLWISEYLSIRYCVKQSRNNTETNSQCCQSGSVH